MKPKYNDLTVEQRRKIVASILRDVAKKVKENQEKTLDK